MIQWSNQSTQRGKDQAAQRLTPRKYKTQPQDQGQSGKTIITTTTAATATTGDVVRAATVRVSFSPNIRTPIMSVYAKLFVLSEASSKWSRLQKFLPNQTKILHA
jgi:hypothetical protein